MTERKIELKGAELDMVHAMAQAMLKGGRTDFVIATTKGAPRRSASLSEAGELEVWEEVQ